MIAHGKRTFFPIALLPKPMKSHTSFITPDAKIRGKPSETVKKNKTSLSEMLASVFLNKNFDLNSPALFHDRKSKLTFKDLDDISTRLAQNLAKVLRNFSGLKPNAEGDTVIAFLLKDDEIDEKVITLIVALQKLGVSYMALDASANSVELCSMISTVKPVALITGNFVENDGIQETMDKINRLEILKIQLNNLWGNAKVESISLDKSIPLLVISDPEYWSDLPLNERTVAIFFTAGSVGSSHGVRIVTRQIFNRIRWQSKVFPLVNSDACALISSLSDPRSLAQIFIPLLAGKPLTILNKKDLSNPTRLVELIADSKLTRMILTPPQFELIVRAISKNPTFKSKLSSVTHWTVTGGTFNATVARKFFQHFSGVYKAGVFLISTYGTTEVLGEATYEVFFNAKDLEEKTTKTGSVSVGVPITNTSVAIIDEMDKSLPMGQRGEIVIFGSCLNAGGYVGQSSSTRAKLNVNRLHQSTTGSKMHLQFRTGDIGRIVLDNNGVRRLFIEGRVDTQVKVGGQMVNLAELHDYIKLTGLVQYTHVLTYHRGRESQAVIAACILKNGATIPQLKKKLREVITKPNVMIPEVFSVTTIPVLSSGRVDKKGIRLIYRNSLLNCDEGDWRSLNLAPAQEETVRIFCKAVALSLGIPLSQVIANYNHSYWDMGGSALSAVMTVKICSDNGLSIAVEDFVSAKTLSQVVERLDRIGNLLEPEAWLLDTDFSGKFSYDLMSPNDEEEVVRILKDDCIPIGVSYSMDVINYWKAFINNVRSNNLCVVAKNSMGKVVGVAINGEAGVKMKLPKTPKEIIHGLEILETCLEASRYQMWRKSRGRTAQTFYLAIKDSQLSEYEGDAITLTQQLMIRTCLAAQSSLFSSVVVATANPLIQETCWNLLKFENLLEFPVSRFKAKDKTRPFTYADDHHTASVMIKDISWDLQQQQDGSGSVSGVDSVKSLSSQKSKVLLQNKFFD